MSQLFAQDQRTMWAWSMYAASSLSLPVSDSLAGRVLEAIPPGDPVEAFGQALVAPPNGYPPLAGDDLPPGTRLAARSFSSWIFVGEGDIVEAFDSSGTHPSHVMYHPGSATRSLSIQLPDGRNARVYADEKIADLLWGGAAKSILRLPDNPLATELPPAASGAGTEASPALVRRGLVVDWRSAEEVALWHMTEVLGFHGSRLTGGSTDRGIDVEHGEAVAQVKMQALPIGSPLIRQLRGTRPHLDHHVFYSTSGYTKAASEEASESGIALFTVADDSSVIPYGDDADALLLEGMRRRGGSESRMADYIDGVRQRVERAIRNYHGEGSRSELEKAFGKRAKQAFQYLRYGYLDLDRAPAIGTAPHRAIAGHYRNCELKAAFFCSTLGLPYPGDGPYAPERREATAGDFY